MIRKLLLIGGDRRALHLEALLKADGFLVDTMGLHTGDEQTVDFAAADAVLLGYPFSVRNGCVPTMTGLTIHPEDVLAKLAPGTLVLAGRGMTDEMAENLPVKRYMEDEWLEERNAQISAEAAVCEAMQRMERALTDMKVLVTGYGLFGRALAKKLRVLGAEVWVAARREEQRQNALSDGMHAVSLERMHQVLPQIHLVLNTIPAQMMGERELCAIEKDSWILELASAPYGFDRKKAQELGLNCDLLPALPARYAPLSAALALKDAVLRLLEEVEA